MRIAIVIPTYCRPDNQTPYYLNRALRSVQSQYHKDYQLYIIGDNFKNKGLLLSLSKKYHFKYINLDHSIEREKYSFGTYQLFCAGGLTPVLKGIDMALNDGFRYICHLDHDDWWEKNHLQMINRVIENYESLFICSLSTYYGGLLPSFDPINEISEYLPNPGCCSMSSACINYSDTLLRLRDVFSETGMAYPADADFWQRLRADIIERNKKGYLVQSITCHHDEEAYSLKGKFA